MGHASGGRVNITELAERIRGLTGEEAIALVDSLARLDAKAAEAAAVNDKLSTLRKVK